jgi:PAS domain S-box-containing protein
MVSISPIAPDEKLKGRITKSVIFFLICFVFFGIGVVTYKDYESALKTQIDNQLATITELKVNDIYQWRKEKFGDAEVIFNNFAFIDIVREHFADPLDEYYKSYTLNWMSKYNDAYQYSKVFLIDDRLQIRLVSPSGDEKLSTEILQNAQKSIDTKQVIFQDLYLNEFTQKPYLGLLVPIFDHENNGKTLGVLYMRIDPQIYLYPYLSEWPLQSETGETLLIRQDGDSALFLNELKFQKDTTLKLRIPLTDTIVPAVRAINGVTGIVEGKDYIGMDVVSYVKPVSDSPWFIITKMSTGEAYKSLQERLTVTTVVVVLAIIILTVSYGMFMSLMNANYYKARVLKDEELRKTKEFLESLLKYANSPIIVWDNEYKIIQFNNAFQKLTGRTESQAIGQNIHIVFPKDKIAESMQIIKGTELGKRWESVEMNIVNTTGKIFTVLWNSATIYSSDGKTPFGTVALGQNITDRKIAEKNLEENVEQLQKINNVMIGRELKMVELKQEIEELKKKLDQNSLQ